MSHGVEDDFKLLPGLIGIKCGGPSAIIDERFTGSFVRKVMPGAGVYDGPPARDLD